MNDLIELINNYPLIAASLIFSVILLLITCVFTISSARRAKGFVDALKASQQQLQEFTSQQTHENKQVKHEFARLSEFQQRASESLIEKLAGNQLKLSESFTQFQSLVQTGFNQFSESLGQKVTSNTQSQQKDLFQFKEQLQENIRLLKEQIGGNQKESQAMLHSQFRQGIKDVREELTLSLKGQQESFTKNMGSLTQSTDERLKEISGQVEKRLSDGFEKTTKTFQDVLKRLALIDDAQKKITDLSSNVVSLQEILADKRSRGAFGEVQLESLVRNVMPPNHYKFQHTFSNNKIVDCALFLPEPTGVIGVDAKFPLENYQVMVDHELSDIERKQGTQNFVKDIKKHINDISSKYIIDKETAAGAVMFIPAEAVFAEIHAHHPQLVEFAQKNKVWLVSPTTMMALLTTASAVLKDEATRKQVHIIQEHLGALSQDFGRFRTRMNNLSKHIESVTKDVREVSISADKISNRFDKIEKVELTHEEGEQEQPVLVSANQALGNDDEK